MVRPRGANMAQSISGKEQRIIADSANALRYGETGHAVDEVQQRQRADDSRPRVQTHPSPFIQVNISNHVAHSI